MMFKVGDLVQHKVTGKVGRIVGYGCQSRDRTYFMTLKVKPLKGQPFPALQRRGFLKDTAPHMRLTAFRGHYFKPPIEDTMNQWRFVHFNSPQLLRSSFRQRQLAA